jgi:hypothetical protein
MYVRYETQTVKPIENSLDFVSESFQERMSERAHCCHYNKVVLDTRSANDKPSSV